MKTGRRETLKLRALALALFLVAPACLDISSAANGGGGNLGKPGDPVHLSIGYQPYYTQAWSGVAMRGKEFWKKYLPPGSTVSFQVGLQGAVIVSQLLAGKQQMGYMGDMPSLVATSKRPTRDIRIVAAVGMSQDQCNIFLVRSDAPDFESPEKAVKWMGGKTVATPQGSCTDRFTRAVFQKLNVKPSAYLNQSIEVISSNFQSKRIDAATVWEPVASRLVNKGLAKRVASGENFNQNDAGFLVASKELLDARPDVVEGYLKGELEAQRWVADPANAMELAQLAVSQTEGYTLRDMWDAMYATEKGAQAGDLSNRMPFVVDKPLQGLVDSSWTFLNKIKVIPQPEPFPGIVQDGIAQTLLAKSGIESPLEVKKLPPSDFKG